MLISVDKRLAYLAMPKTATTAVQKALHPYCDIHFARFPRAKHMNMGAFERYMMPYLREIGAGDTETFCMVREPVDLLGSWYRYRSREELDGLPNSTKGKSFAEFVEAYLENPAPPFARVGRISQFVAGTSGEPAVTHMFRYENMKGLTRFLEERFETRIALPRINVSSRAELALPADLRARLEVALAADFALYESLAR